MTGRGVAITVVVVLMATGIFGWLGSIVGVAVLVALVGDAVDARLRVGEA